MFFLWVNFVKQFERKSFPLDFEIGCESLLCGLFSLFRVVSGFSTFLSVLFSHFLKNDLSFFFHSVEFMRCKSVYILSLNVLRLFTTQLLTSFFDSEKYVRSLDNYVCAFSPLIPRILFFVFFSFQVFSVYIVPRHHLLQCLYVFSQHCIFFIILKEDLSLQYERRTVIELSLGGYYLKSLIDNFCLLLWGTQQMFYKIAYTNMTVNI